MQQQMQQMAPCPVVPVGTWVGEGGGHASKALLSLSGQELERGKYGGGPVVVVLARIGVAVPEPCRCCPQVRCVRCIFAASAAMLGTLGLLWHTPAGSEAQGKMARGWGRAPPRHSCNSHKTHQQNALARSTMQSPTARSMAAWKAGKPAMGVVGGRRGWHSGRLETRQSHGFKISRLNLAGPCRRLGGLGCCPALRLLGAPFPDPSSTTTHTTHAHGTRRPSILHQQATLARAWDDPVGASLLAFLSSMGTVVFGLGGATLLLFAHGDDGCVSKGAAPFCVLPMGACRGRVTGHLASTGQQLQPSSLLCADR